MYPLKRLDFTYRTSIKFEFPAIDHSFSLRYMPRPSRVQRLLACEISLTPDVAWSLQKDGFGNLMPEQGVVHFELLSRTLSFYGCVVLCGTVTLLAYLLLRQRDKKRRASAEPRE